MSICDKEGCTEIGKHYTDWSVTGIGDFRYYCDDHIEEAKRLMHIRDTGMSIEYRIGLFLTKPVTDFPSIRDDAVKYVRELTRLAEDKE